MSDPASTARNARESLSRGLNALQSDPNVPPQLLELAAPIAKAMGALHQIERSNGVQLVPHAQVALENVRTALAQLQAQPPAHPAIAASMESVAGSLSLVHALARLAGPQPAAPAPAPAQPAAFPQPPQPAAMAPPRPAYPQAAAPIPPPAHAAPRFPQQQPFGGPSPMVAPDPFAAPPPMAAADPFAAPPMQQPVAPQGDAPVVNAELGAQSPTNFYKGLSGNDIIDHGGLFVSTYKIPKIGSQVRLRVSLPGGYEFEANAVVRWRRDADGGSDAPPGFGAQFTQITAEARQLVYRYVRNREPLFHDDL